MVILKDVIGVILEMVKLDREMVKVCMSGIRFNVEENNNTFSVEMVDIVSIFSNFEDIIY